MSINIVCYQITNKSITNNGNNSIVGSIGSSISIKDNQERKLTKQEQALLQIYNNADGKTQMKIMQFMYDLEEKEKR